MFAAVLLLIACSGGSLVAHHSFSMFEMDKNVTYTGVVVEYMWNNPHVHFTSTSNQGPGVDPATVGDGMSKADPPTSWRARGGRAPR